jgi:cytochrome c556
VQDQRLHQLMTAMNNLMFDNLRTEIEIDQERRKKALQIAESAEALSKTVSAIPSTLPALNLNPADQGTFLALARKLRTETEQLGEQARSNQIDAIPATWKELTSTCTACHGLYRKIGR